MSRLILVHPRAVVQASDTIRVDRYIAASQRPRHPRNQSQQGAKNRSMGFLRTKNPRGFNHTPLPSPPQHSIQLPPRTSQRLPWRQEQHLAEPLSRHQRSVSETNRRATQQQGVSTPQPISSPAGPAVELSERPFKRTRTAEGQAVKGPVARGQAPTHEESQATDRFAAQGPNKSIITSHEE